MLWKVLKFRGIIKPFEIWDEIVPITDNTEELQGMLSKFNEAVVL